MGARGLPIMSPSFCLYRILLTFFFSKIPYKQKEALTMGNPLAPTLPNIFLCDLKIIFLNNYRNSYIVGLVLFHC